VERSRAALCTERARLLAMQMGKEMKSERLWEVRRQEDIRAQRVAETFKRLEEMMAKRKEIDGGNDSEESFAIGRPLPRERKAMRTTAAGLTDYSNTRFHIAAYMDKLAKQEGDTSGNNTAEKPLFDGIRPHSPDKLPAPRHIGLTEEQQRNVEMRDRLVSERMQRDKLIQACEAQLEEMTRADRKMKAKRASEAPPPVIPADQETYATRAVRFERRFGRPMDSGHHPHHHYHQQQQHQQLNEREKDLSPPPSPSPPSPPFGSQSPARPLSEPHPAANARECRKTSAQLVVAGVPVPPQVGSPPGSDKAAEVESGVCQDRPDRPDRPGPAHTPARSADVDVGVAVDEGSASDELLTYSKTSYLTSPFLSDSPTPMRLPDAKATSPPRQPVDRPMDRLDAEFAAIPERVYQEGIIPPQSPPPPHSAAESGGDGVRPLVSPQRARLRASRGGDTDAGRPTMTAVPFSVPPDRLLEPASPEQERPDRSDRPDRPDRPVASPERRRRAPGYSSRNPIAGLEDFREQLEATMERVVSGIISIEEKRRQSLSPDRYGGRPCTRSLSPDNKRATREDDKHGADAASLSRNNTSPPRGARQPRYESVPKSHVTSLACTDDTETDAPGHGHGVPVIPPPPMPPCSAGSIAMLELQAMRRRQEGSPHPSSPSVDEIEIPPFSATYKRGAIPDQPPLHRPPSVVASLPRSDADNTSERGIDSPPACCVPATEVPTLSATPQGDDGHHRTQQPLHEMVFMSPSSRQRERDKSGDGDGGAAADGGLPPPRHTRQTATTESGSLTLQESFLQRMSTLAKRIERRHQAVREHSDQRRRQHDTAHRSPHSRKRSPHLETPYFGNAPYRSAEHTPAHHHREVRLGTPVVHNARHGGPAAAAGGRQQHRTPSFGWGGSASPSPNRRR